MSTPRPVSRLKTDSIVYCPFGGCQPAILSSDTLTGRLTFGHSTSDLSAPAGGLDLGTIVDAFDDAVFAGNTTGKALVDTDGIVTVVLAPDATDPDPYDFFIFTGKIENGIYSGRFTNTCGGHTNGYGSFVTVP